MFSAWSVVRSLTSVPLGREVPFCIGKRACKCGTHCVVSFRRLTRPLRPLTKATLNVLRVSSGALRFEERAEQLM